MGTLLTDSTLAGKSMIVNENMIILLFEIVPCGTGGSYSVAPGEDSNPACHRIIWQSCLNPLRPVADSKNVLEALIILVLTQNYMY